MYVIYVIVSSILCAQLIKGATSWLNGLKSLARILQFVICNPCQSPPSLTILVPLWFISRATRLEVYPRIWFQSSVTCIGQYRRHEGSTFIPPMSTHDVEFDAKRKRYFQYVYKWCHLFYVQTLRPTHC